ncbi:MAG TPA: hypothetical protein VGR71_18385 [Nitrospira sp.]|nr:hypothetical protein [Nitrospira sp.]
MSDIPANFVDYFSAQILALYQSQPNRYTVQTDYFSGEITTADAHY